MKKRLLTILAVFVTMFVLDFFIHGMILKPTYQATASMWRPEMSMPQYCIWMLAGKLVLSCFFTLIFIPGYKGKGPKEGVRFGFLIGGLQAGGQLIMYSVMPYPLHLTMSWILLGFVENAILGAVAAKTYSSIRG